MSRPYIPMRASNRWVAYNGHRIMPKLDIPSRVAWALAFEASRRGIYVADLITTALVSWAQEWEYQLGEADRRHFAESIPFHRGPYKQDE